MLNLCQPSESQRSLPCALGLIWFTALADPHRSSLFSDGPSNVLGLRHLSSRSRSRLVLCLLTEKPLLVRGGGQTLRCDIPIPLLNIRWSKLELPHHPLAVSLTASILPCESLVASSACRVVLRPLAQKPLHSPSSTPSMGWFEHYWAFGNISFRIPALPISSVSSSVSVVLGPGSLV